METVRYLTLGAAVVVLAGYALVLMWGAAVPLERSSVGTHGLELALFGGGKTRLRHRRHVVKRAWLQGRSGF